MRELFILIILVLFFTTSLCQVNLIQNGGFEEEKTPNPLFPKPFDYSQMEDCKYWENFNTSDWYTTKKDLTGHYRFIGKYALLGNNWQFSVAYLFPQDGSKHYAGFGSCEGMQTFITKKLQQYCSPVKLTFWFSPRGYQTNTILNAYLLNEKASSNALDNCSTPNIDINALKFEIPVVASTINAENRPGQWYYFESDWLNTLNNKYSWFAIKGYNQSGDLFDNQYVYVDNIKLNYIPYCDNPCRPILPQINLDPGTSDGTLPNVTMPDQQPWHVYLENAVAFELYITAEWQMGDTVYYDTDFHPTGFKKRIILWNGTNNSNIVQPLGVYNFTLNAFNCDYGVSQWQGSISLISGSSTTGTGNIATHYITDPDPDNPISCDWVGCCDYCKTISNITITGNKVYEATSCIETQNNVTINSGSRVLFTAGDIIKLHPNFRAYEGVDFRATLGGCTGTLTTNKKPKNTYIIESPKILEEDTSETILITAELSNFPNPFHSITNITYTIMQLQPVTLTIKNILGKEVARLINNETQDAACYKKEFDASLLKPGVYFYVLQTGSSIETQKMVKISE